MAFSPVRVITRFNPMRFPVNHVFQPASCLVMPMGNCFDSELSASFIETSILKFSRSLSNRERFNESERMSDWFQAFSYFSYRREGSLFFILNWKIITGYLYSSVLSLIFAMEYCLLNPMQLYQLDI